MLKNAADTIDEMRVITVDLVNANVRCKNEAAKLRELAGAMWPYIWEAYYSGEMQYKDYATIRDRMQELGIGGSRGATTSRESAYTCPGR